jgi:hypothetical protein
MYVDKKMFIYLIVSILIFVLIHILFFTKNPLHKLFFKDCYEKGGINSNVWCVINKDEDCSSYGWWGGVCGDIQSCKILSNITKIPCYELEERDR